MPQLDFSNPLTIAQVVWMAIIFGVLYYVLARYTLPQVAEVVDGRANRIAADLDSARAAKAQSDAAIAEVNEALGREVGPGWVNLFDGDLDAEVLLDTARRVRDQPPQAPPDLSARGWAAVGAAHLEAYRRALAQRHGPRRTAAPASVSR